MDFQKRLEKAVERGQRQSDAAAKAKADEALGEEELRRLHAQYRRELAERIEACVGQLPPHFPGFRFETIVGEKGWGAAITRDDLTLDGGKRNNLFSKLELLVRPFSSAHVLEAIGKGTIRNKEIFARNYFQQLTQVDITSFQELVDRWVLEFAELYAAKS